METELPWQAHGASLRVYGDIGDPRVITWSVEVEPHTLFCRGDVRPAVLTPDHRGWRSREPAPHDYWSWQSTVDEDAPMADHLRQLIDRFDQRVDVIRGVAPRAGIDVFCGYRTNRWEGGFSLPADVVEGLQHLGLDVGFSVIVL